MSALADEWRITAREPMFRWACGLLILLTALCLWNGQRFKAERDAQAQSEITRSLDKREADKETLRKEAAGTVPANPWGPSEPTKADWNAARPSGPLAGLSFGQEDIEPLSANVSLWMVRTDNLFRKYELGSPLSLAAGRFDAGFLVVLLLPLFALALTYNVVAQERETGRLRLATVQGESTGTRLAIRMMLRLSPVFACLLAIAVVAAAWGAPLDRLLLWTGAALLYLLFWAGISALIATLSWRQEVLALTAAGVWLVLIVLLPAIGAATARALVPSPSSFALINGVREASNEANARLLENLESYVSDHPELMNGDPTEDDWAAKLYVSQQVIETEIAPVLAAQAERDARQEGWINRFRFLSPAAAVDQVLTDAAGTGRDRQRNYVEQVKAFLIDWRKTLSPMIFQRARITAADVDGLPRFAFREPPPDYGRSSWSLLYLALLSFLILGLAIRRTRSIGRSAMAYS